MIGGPGLVIEFLEDWGGLLEKTGRDKRFSGGISRVDGWGGSGEKVS